MIYFDPTMHKTFTHRKQVILCAAVAITLHSCQTATPKEKTLARVDEYNSELARDSASLPVKTVDSLYNANVIDTTPINSKFDQLEMGTIPREGFQQIEHDLTFQRLLTLEKSLLSR